VYDPPNDFEWENLLISRRVHCMPEMMMIYDRMAWGYSGASIINDDYCNGIKLDTTSRHLDTVHFSVK
jgi:hypothetical protein